MARKFGKLREELFSCPWPQLWLANGSIVGIKVMRLIAQQMPIWWGGGGGGSEGSDDRHVWMKLAERIPLFFYTGVFFRIKHCIIYKQIISRQKYSPKIDRHLSFKTGKPWNLAQQALQSGYRFLVPFTVTVSDNFLFLMGMLGYFLKLSGGIKEMQGLNSYLPAYSWSLEECLDRGLTDGIRVPK